MRALFIWETPPPPPPQLTPREVFLLVDVDMGVWSGVDPDSDLAPEIATALAKREALDQANLAPFVAQPDISIEGYRDGLAWGYVDVHPEARTWRALLVPTTSLARLGEMLLTADVVSFSRHRVRGCRGAVFVCDGLDVERAVKVLSHVLGRAA